MSAPAKTPLLHKLPLTLFRLKMARCLYRCLHFFLRKDIHLIHRRGLSFEVDLREGIDLSLFLFGNFQNYIFESPHTQLKPDAVVFDVGANIGSMALRFAQKVPQGKVIAFEPTHFALKKLQRNLELNPTLAKNVEIVHTFLSDTPSQKPTLVAYSSWKVDHVQDGSHPLHGGQAQAADDVPSTTLDQFCQDHNITRVDLIKIDTDGHEFKILKGAQATLARHQPRLIFELALYALEEQGETFEDLFSYMADLGYQWINTKNNHVVTLENFRQEIPLKASTDILAVPRKQ